MRTTRQATWRPSWSSPQQVSRPRRRRRPDGHRCRTCPNESPPGDTDTPDIGATLEGFIGTGTTSATKERHHRDWSDPQRAPRSPRSQQVNLLQHSGGRFDVVDTRPPRLLRLHGRGDHRGSGTGSIGHDRAEAVHRLSAAITIHDSVLGGVLCPLLESLENGRPLAARIREGCLHRGRTATKVEHLGQRSHARRDLSDAGPTNRSDLKAAHR